jgi:hypothetical protein
MPDRPNSLSSEYLLRLVLEWYSRPSNHFASRVQGGPYSGSARTAAAADGGRWAARALAAQDVGSLLLVACDILDVALTDLSRRAEIPMHAIQEIASGRHPTEPEGAAIRRLLEAARP